MSQLQYSELIETNQQPAKLQDETFRENYTTDDYNSLKKTLESDDKYDYKSKVLLYNTQLPPSLTDAYNEDLTTKITLQNYLYITGVFSMGVMLISAINLARN